MCTIAHIASLRWRSSRIAVVIPILRLLPILGFLFDQQFQKLKSIGEALLSGQLLTEKQKILPVNE